MNAGAFTLYKDKPREKAIQRIAAFLSLLDIGKDWEITIALKKRCRSSAQNNYLWGVAYKILSDQTGFESEEIAEYMLGRYFGWHEKKVPKKPSNPTGFESVPIRSTTRDAEGKRCVLSTLEFSEYVAYIQRFAAHKGWVIPDPDPEYARHREAA